MLVHKLLKVLNKVMFKVLNLFILQLNYCESNKLFYKIQSPILQLLQF